MIYHTFSFNNLPAHKLVPYLITFFGTTDLSVRPLKNTNYAKTNLEKTSPDNIDSSKNCSKHCINVLPWHICWLNNDGKQVIGLLPKTSWTVYKPVYEKFPHKQEPNLEPVNPSNSQEDNHNLKVNILKSSRQKTSVKRLANLPQTGFNPTLINDPSDIKSSTKNKLYLSKNTTYTTLYNEWINELIEYSKTHNEDQFESILSKPVNKNNEELNSYSNNHSFNHVNSYYHGFMGFIGYDISAKALSPHSNIVLPDQPCAFMAHYDIYLTPNTSQDSTGINSTGQNRTGQDWQLHIHSSTSPEIKALVLYCLQLFEGSLNFQYYQTKELPTPILPLTPLWNLQQYERAFNQTQQYLYRGDSYQINLTQKWQGKLPKPSTVAADSIHLVNYLPALHNSTNAPFAGYLGITHTNNLKEGIDALSPNKTPERPTFELLSCSPELFVMFNKSAEGKQQVLTKPIKGTVPRGITPEDDIRLKQQLANSTKDKAENVMIVDLLRNDLGKYAETGSVKVPKLFAIESFSNVHHMVSNITAIIKPEYHPLTLLFDSLPAGSITGAPKKRAVEIISELESGPRGAYCGTMGYMNFNGTGQWNVLIRTLQADAQGDVALWAGGGITVGSECNSEYQECHDKVSNLINILNSKSINNS